MKSCLLWVNETQKLQHQIFADMRQNENIVGLAQLLEELSCTFSDDHDKRNVVEDDFMDVLSSIEGMIDLAVQTAKLISVKKPVNDVNKSTI